MSDIGRVRLNSIVRHLWREIPSTLQQAIGGHRYLGRVQPPNTFLQRWLYHYVLEIWHSQIAEVA